MRIPRIFQELPLIEGATVSLDEAGSHHLGQVLRVKAGEQVILFNGTGGEYFGDIVSVGKRSVEVHLTYFNEADRASPLHVHLGQVMGKGERMDYALQKAVELGVTEITPLTSHRCEVRLQGERLAKKQQQWQQLVIAACEQSGLNVVPRVHAPIPLSDWLAQTQAECRWLLHTDGDHTALFNRPAPGSVAIAVGPEGGFDDDEALLAREQGFQCVTVGPRVWRTETAPVVMLSLLQHRWGDLTGD
jgi:16S rRNA (uracil1498-N3)-methyltransferase